MNSTSGEPTPRKVYFVSLGCPKNQVDTEVMLGIVRDEGQIVVDSPEEADTLVVNTCAFIESAKVESIDTMLELAQHKAAGNKTLVMTGCLSQRYSEDLSQELPEVDHFLGSSDMLGLRDVLRGSAPRNAVSKLSLRSYLYDHSTPRRTIGSSHTNFVKIAEGCDRPCAFCIIPQLRGPQRSRTVYSLVEEVTALVESGTKEISLIGQDLTRYGTDLEERGLAPANLEQLVDALGEVRGLVWIRLHYAYPTATTPGLVSRISQHPKVASYLDVPFQHIDSDVLKSMRRGYGERAVRDLVELIRKQQNHIWLRTTMLVGHPGETQESYQRLYDFIAEGEIDHLGVFPWSREDGTAAALLPKRVPEAVARERAEELMQLQEQIRAEKQRKFVGTVMNVLIDGVSDESEFLLDGRHEGQAPEIDGKVIVCDADVKPGTFVDVRILQATAHDFVASVDLDREPDESEFEIDLSQRPRPRTAQ
jgi:ribosomal protein S12 methylthiotransferase